MIGFSFREVMEGMVQREGERFDRPFRFELDVTAPSVLDERGDVWGTAELRFSMSRHLRGLLASVRLTRRGRRLAHA